MQIALWSNNSSGDGTTSLSTVLATLIAAKNNHKTLLTHTMTDDLSMEYYVLNEEERKLYNQIGESNTDSLFRLINNGKLDADNIKDYCYSLLSHSNLDFLSSTKIYETADSYCNNYMYLNHVAKQFYDVVVTDLNVSMEHPLFERVLKESDVLIIVGNQNAYDLKKLKEKINSNRDKLRSYGLKIHFALNKYDALSNQKAAVLLKDFNVKKPLMIPYSINLIDSCNRSELVDYVLRQMHSRKGSEFYKYIKEVERLSEQVMLDFEEV